MPDPAKQGYFETKTILQNCLLLSILTILVVSVKVEISKV